MQKSCFHCLKAYSKHLLKLFYKDFMVNIRDANIYASSNGGERGPPKVLHKPSSSPPPPPPMGEVKEGSVFISSGDYGTLIMVP